MKLSDEQTAKHEPVKITNGDIAAIAFQIGLTALISSLTFTIQIFYIACAAYAGMVASIGWRAKKQGLTPKDRRNVLLALFRFSF